jgi:hypothetical protein
MNASSLAKKTITRNIFRFGWHFPGDLVSEVLASLGLTTESQINELRNPLASQSNVASEFATTENLIDLMLDLFPKIPHSDLMDTVNHAFKSVRSLLLVWVSLTGTRELIGWGMPRMSHSPVEFSSPS